MKRTIIFALTALGTTSAAFAAVPMMYEEAMAREEEKRILTSPIAGIQNKYWFDYRIDITEAQKELTSDLGKADDIEDRRDAWEEYAEELSEEREDYIKKMAKRGYRMGTVTITQ